LDISTPHPSPLPSQGRGSFKNSVAKFVIAAWDIGRFQEVILNPPYPLFQRGVKNQLFSMDNQLRNRPLGGTDIGAEYTISQFLIMFYLHI
jgi:hypothetical protein